MPRSRRDWTAMLAEVRLLIREPTAVYWTDAELLTYFNASIDLRVMELAEQHEGWVTDVVVTNVVANQVEYTLPEGTGRVKRVLLVYDASTDPVHVPLQRKERFSDAMAESGGEVGYRVVGNLIMIEPPISRAMTNGLAIEVESAPDRLTAGGNKLDLRFPDIMEELLVLDTAIMAFAVEDTQGNQPEGYVNGISKRRDEYAKRFFEYTATRTYGRVIGKPFYLGD